MLIILAPFMIAICRSLHPLNVHITAILGELAVQGSLCHGRLCAGAYNETTALSYVHDAEFVEAVDVLSAL